MTIPTNPSLNEEWTNDATGVTYVWDGERWFIKPGETEDLVTQDEFETVQGQIQETITDALEVQEKTLKKDESNTVTAAFRIRSDSKTFISTASGDLGFTTLLILLTLLML